jgi:TetR/AcrR family transcriptional repressor of bet genes
MSRRSNTEQRRAEIASALLAVMAEHGYEKATIQLIGKQAGLAPGLLHYHFKTKGEILLALVKTMAELARQRYLDLAATASTADEFLRAYIHARLARGDGADPHAVAAWVMIGAEAVRQPDVRAVYQDAVRAELQLIEAMLTACFTERGKPAGAVPALAATLLALIEGAFQLASAAPEAMPVGYAARTAIEVVERYMAGE